MKHAALLEAEYRSYSNLSIPINFLDKSELFFLMQRSKTADVLPGQAAQNQMISPEMIISSPLTAPKVQEIPSGQGAFGTHQRCLDGYGTAEGVEILGTSNVIL